MDDDFEDKWVRYMLVVGAVVFTLCGVALAIAIIAAVVG